MRNSVWGNCNTNSDRFIVLLYIITLISFGFYHYYTFDAKVLKFLGMIEVVILIFMTRKQLILSKKNVPFYNDVRYIFYITLFSIFMSYVFWNQPVILGYRITYSSFFIVIFFLLYKAQPTVLKIEKYVIILSVVYIILWIYAFMHFPLVVFGDPNDAFDLSRGIVRIRLDGGAFLILSFFICLNKFIVERKKKFIFYAIIFFSFIVLQVTRQVILISFAIGLVYVFKEKRKLKYISIFVALSLYFAGTTIKFSDKSIFGIMMEMTENQIQDNTKGYEDIRILDYKMFFTDYSANVCTDLFGNGFPHSESSYGMRYTRMTDSGYFLSDVGYASMYVTIGIIGLLLYVLLFIKGIMSKVDKKYMYARLFFIYMLFANIASDCYLYVDYQIIMCICLYILGKYSVVNKYIRNIL